MSNDEDVRHRDTKNEKRKVKARTIFHFSFLPADATGSLFSVLNSQLYAVYAFVPGTVSAVSDKKGTPFESIFHKTVSHNG